MPVSARRQKRYPGGSLRSQLWQDLRAWVRLRSGNRCEGTPQFPDCRARNGLPHPETGAIVVLTVAHMSHDLKKNGPGDLRHLCQRCHNAWDAPFRANNRKINARRRRREAHEAMRKELGL